MKPSINATSLNPGNLKRLQTLMSLIAKSNFKHASVKVVHNYNQHECGADFTFESFDGGKQGYMSGRGGTIRRGDHIILHNGSELARYQVDEIDYDAVSSDWWIALLCACSGTVDRRFWMKPVEDTYDSLC